MDGSVSLRELLESRFMQLEQRIEESQRTHSAVHAVAELNINRRLDEMNELRDQITEERGRYITRDQLDSRLGQTIAEYHALAERNAARLSILESQVSNLQGRLWAFGAAVTVLIAGAALLVKFL